MLSHLKGRKGEELAAEYLREQGFGIEKRNYTCPYGEVDIIARREDLLVFVEVKCWDACPPDDLGCAVNGKKRNRIRRSAMHYLAERRELDRCALRFDLIYLSRRMESLDHLENAF